MTDAATAPAPRRYGKRKLPDTREKFIAVRCTDAEYAAITAAAAQAGLTVGPFLRALALGSPGKRSVRRPPVEKEALARLLGELGKIGGNVNQIARAVNTVWNVPVRTELERVNATLDTLRTALLKALGSPPSRGQADGD